MEVIALLGMASVGEEKFWRWELVLATWQLWMYLLPQNRILKNGQESKILGSVQFYHNLKKKKKRNQNFLCPASRFHFWVSPKVHSHFSVRRYILWMGRHTLTSQLASGPTGVNNVCLENESHRWIVSLNNLPIISIFNDWSNMKVYLFCI